MAVAATEQFTPTFETFGTPLFLVTSPEFPPQAECFVAAPLIDEPEQYAHSLSTLRRVGALAVAGSKEPEFGVAKEMAFTDLMSAVTEMLVTDPELGPHFEISKPRTFAVKEGKVRASDGTPMVEIIKRGFQSSHELATYDPVFTAQAIRDEGDVQNMLAVDELPVGKTRVVVSMEPKEELKYFPEIYKEVLGYREGLAYIQEYTRTAGDTVIATAYSVDHSDESTWRQVMAEYGTIVPEGESSNTWIRHAIVVDTKPGDQPSLGAEIRQRYYHHSGRPDNKLSLSDITTRLEPTARQLFDIYYTDLALAITSGHNTQSIQSLAGEVLRTSGAQLEPDVRSQLIHIANAQKFNEADARLMESMMRYAITEELRVMVVDIPKTRDSLRTEPIIVRHHDSQQTQLNWEATQAQSIQQRMVTSFNRGVEAKRTYGGCPGQTKFATDSDVNGSSDLSSLDASPQDVFGGNDNNEGGGGSSEVCDFVSKECPICHTKNVKTKVTKTHIEGDCGCRVKKQSGSSTQVYNKKDDDKQKRRASRSVWPVAWSSKEAALPKAA